MASPPSPSNRGTGRRRRPAFTCCCRARPWSGDLLRPPFSLGLVALTSSPSPSSSSSRLSSRGPFLHHGDLDIRHSLTTETVVPPARGTTRTTTGGETEDEEEEEEEELAVDEERKGRKRVASPFAAAAAAELLPIALLFEWALSPGAAGLQR